MFPRMRMGSAVTVFLIGVLFLVIIVMLSKDNVVITCSEPLAKHTLHDHKTTSPFNTKSSSIDLPDRFQMGFHVSGHLFSDKGVHMNINHSLTSSVIHSFSPYTENRFREMMLDPRHEHRIYANSPAIMWLKGELVCVMRIWLDKELYEEKKAEEPSNKFSDNYLYIQKFDRRLRPVTPGSVLGIPTPQQWIVGDGPIEPRLFKINDENVYVSYNTGVVLENKNVFDGTYFWDYLRHRSIEPTIEGGSPIAKTTFGRMPRDKHWTPYINDGQLEMVYNLDPLRVLSCGENFTCKFNHFEGPENYQFTQYHDSLRGGTPWTLYKHPYYYSIGHTTLFKSPSYDRIYTINLIVYKARPIPRVVYLSGPIQIHSKPMMDIPIVRIDYIKDPFFFPVSLIKEDGDSIIVGGHINDYSSVLLRIRGVQTILRDVVEEDSKQPENMVGPPPNTLHSSTKLFASLATNNRFFSS